MLNCVNNLNLEPQSMNSGIERAALMVSEEKHHQDSRKISPSIHPLFSPHLHQLFAERSLIFHLFHARLSHEKSRNSLLPAPKPRRVSVSLSYMHSNGFLRPFRGNFYDFTSLFFSFSTRRAKHHLGDILALKHILMVNHVREWLKFTHMIFMIFFSSIKYSSYMKNLTLTYSMSCYARRGCCASLTRCGDKARRQISLPYFEMYCAWE